MPPQTVPAPVAPSGGELVNLANQIGQNVSGNTGGQTVPMGDVASQILAGGPTIMTPQQMVAATGMSPFQAGGAPVQPSTRSLIPPTPIAQGKMQQVPWNQSLEARRTVKQQNIGTMLGNFAATVANSVEQKKFADKVDTIQKATTMLDQQQKSKQLAAMYPGDVRIQQLAKQTIDENEKKLEAMKNDPKASKILREAKLDYTNPKEMTTDDDKRAAVAALKNVNAGNQAGTNANTPQEKQVEELLKKGQATQAMGPNASQQFFRQQAAPQGQQGAGLGVQPPQAPPQAQPQAATQPPPAGLPTNMTRWDSIVDKGLANYPNVTKNQVYALMGKESGGDPNAVSETGVTGVMQITQDVANTYGVTDRKDPKQNIPAGIGRWNEALQRQGGNQALAAADYFHGPDAIKNGQIVDKKAAAYARDFMTRLNSMNAGAAPSPTPPAGAISQKPPDMTQRAAPSPNFAGMNRVGPTVPGQAAPQMQVVDASKSKTPFLDAYAKANPTMLQESPQYAMMLQRQAMMEKAYYEKMAPEMMKGYLDSMKQDKSLQSKEFIARMNNVAKLTNDYAQIQQKNYTADKRYQQGIDGARVRGELGVEAARIRADAVLQAEKDKNTNPYTALRMMQNEYSQNTAQIGHYNSMISQLTNAMQNIDLDTTLTSEAKQAKKDSYNSLIDSYRQRIGDLNATNDMYRVGTNRLLLQNPLIGSQYAGGQDFNQQVQGATNWQSQLPGGGGTSGGAGSIPNNPFFYQQPQSAQQPPTSGAGGASQTQAPTQAAPSTQGGGPYDDTERSIIDGLFKAPPSKTGGGQ